MIIWLASYPRSGNTFLRVMLNSVFGLETYSIYDDKSDIAKDAATTEIVGHKMLPEGFDLDAARNSDDLYLIKTHDVPGNPDDKAIYLLRDGRQSALSYMNYIKLFHDERCTIQDVIYGNVFFGSWGDHIDNWNPANRTNTLLLRFEDLVASPHSFLKQISGFIGIREQKGEIPGFKELHQINSKFFRQGMVDSWKAELAQDDIHAFWLNNLKQMRELYPAEQLPELFKDESKALQVGNLVNKQRKYYSAVSTDLKDALHKSEHEVRALENAVLNHEKTISSHESTIAQLENSLLDTTRTLTAIQSAILDMVNVKIWKSPIEKFRAYKSLLKVVFGTGG